MTKIGDKVRFVPSGFARDKETFGNGMTIPIKVTGTVVWIHPKRRFYLVEADVDGVTVRETFPMEGE